MTICSTCRYRSWYAYLHILELASVLVNWHRSATSARFKKFSHVNEDETSSFAVFEDLNIVLGARREVVAVDLIHMKDGENL